MGSKIRFSGQRFPFYPTLQKVLKEIVQFLYIAKGSCGEVRAQLHLAKALGYIPSDIANTFIQQSAKISAQLYNLIQYRQLHQPIHSS